jgi:hypothetical protein
LAGDRERIVMFCRDFHFAFAGRSIALIITKITGIAGKMLGSIGSGISLRF